jgi:hypothetical protein
VLGFPIRTPSDHSSVDNSPRTIAASHVLHRLLMPRHPPCALTHLTTTRCSHPLCNTQHTTTPQQPHRHHEHHARVRNSRTRSGTKNTPTKKRVSPQDPTVREPAAGIHRPRPEQAAEVFHPATPTPHQQPPVSCSIRCGISERRDTHLQSA